MKKQTRPKSRRPVRLIEEYQRKNRFYNDGRHY